MNLQDIYKIFTGSRQSPFFNLQDVANLYKIYTIFTWWSFFVSKEFT